MSYFLGNDFLPHIPSIDIKKKGLDILLNAYVKTLKKQNFKLFYSEDKKIRMNHFISQDSSGEICVNNLFLVGFLEYLKIKEEAFFRDHYRKKPRKRICFSHNQFEKEKFKMDNLQFKINDPIRLGSDEIELWKERYYNHYFYSNNKDYVDEICKNFLEGLLWVSHYYLNECYSWNWYYSYNQAPMISDLYMYFEENLDCFDIINFNDTGPLDPFIQLLSVLHPSCNYLLPKHLRYLMVSSDSPIIDLYPYFFQEDMIGKDMLWKCIPILPPLDIDRIMDNVSYKYINKDEEERNKIKNIYKNYSL